MIALLKRFRLDFNNVIVMVDSEKRPHSKKYVKNIPTLPELFTVCWQSFSTVNNHKYFYDVNVTLILNIYCANQFSVFHFNVQYLFCCCSFSLNRFVDGVAPFMLHDEHQDCVSAPWQISNKQFESFRLKVCLRDVYEPHMSFIVLCVTSS